MDRQSYLKVPFVWQEPKPLSEVPSRLKFKAAQTFSHATLLSVVALVMESSIDLSDRQQVLKRGSHQAAKLFIAESRNGFSYQDEWWQIGVNSDDKIVGFVFPVVYEGCAKENLEEGTIYYIGVLPKYRGRGFATDLLLKATRILQDVGVWRVFCDTDVNNIAMISTFERVGYQQYGEPMQRFCRE